MAILTDQLKRQLQERFAGQLSGPVQLTLYTRPGTGRLILPGGLGCATCDDARQLAEELQTSAPDLISLRVVDVSLEEDDLPPLTPRRMRGGGEESEVREVPTLMLGFPGEAPRIGWQGLPAGYEFATVVDAIERVSTGGHGLSETSLEALGGLTELVDIMVFATPT